MPDVIADRRVSPRYPLVLAAEIIEMTTRSKMTVRSSDISRTGCYIDTLNPVTSGSKILVRLVHGKETFESYGTIRYVSPGLGMGIQFDDQIPANQLALLDRWLAEAAELSSC